VIAAAPPKPGVVARVHGAVALPTFGALVARTLALRPRA
jgi:hypothetical protein